MRNVGDKPNDADPSRLSRNEITLDFDVKNLDFIPEMTQNKSDNWVRIFQVSCPKKHKDGFIIYKVSSVVFPKGAPEAVTNIVVWKRFKDFKKLHNSLKHYHKKYTISEDLPKLHQKNYFNWFERDIIQERIKCELELLNFVARHPPLFTCAPFLQFFNNSYQVSDAITNYELGEILKDNGNVIDGSNKSFAFGFSEKTLVNGEIKKDNVISDERHAADSDNSFLNSSCSEDEDDISLSKISCMSVPVNPPQNDIALNDSNAIEAKSTFEKLDGDSKGRSIPTHCSRSNIICEKSNLEGIHSSMARSLTCLPDYCNPANEMTGHVEEALKDSEMWIYVVDEGLQSKSHSNLTSNSNFVDGVARNLFAHENYLVEAAGKIGQAQSYEVGGEYEAAFHFYKAAIACLLRGISGDGDEGRRLIVQEKIKRYAERAENVYASHLSKKNEERERTRFCTEGLKVYKVLSVIDKVILVLNTSENKRYIIKVLEKSPCPIDARKKTIIPYDVPYMVKLVKYFENENSVFLILQYASGGKLLDHVDHFFRSYQSMVKILNDNESGSLSSYPSEGYIDGDRTESEKKSEKSYFEMLREYTAYTARRVFGYAADERAPPKSEEPKASPEEYKSNGDDCCENGREDGEAEENPVDDDLDVSYLVKNSQKLLESIKSTLEQSDFATDVLNEDLKHLESAFDLGKESPGANECGENRFAECCAKKRSRSVAQSRFEKRSSYEDISSSKCRTVSNSLDRRSQRSRLLSLLESPPVLSEGRIREWAAEMFVALETLHRWGITCRDLHPGNILIDDKGHLLLTFQFYWRDVDSSLSEEAVAGMYAAPETSKIFPVAPSADWWSFGALLFQLLTGKTLSSCYPGGIFSHTILKFPDFLSPEACSLLTELLRYEPSERLGGGMNGSDDIKCHPFFSSVDWQFVYEN